MSNNILTLYFNPSPLGFDWSNPRSLALSAVRNKLTLKKRFMGHVFIKMEGTLSSGEEIEIVTGMKAKKLNALPLIFLKGYGLGVLFHSFDGHLESKSDVWEEIKTLAQDQRLSFAEFKISTSAFDHLVNYYLQYKNNNIGRYYGFTNRPLYGEGAGCSAFGASFLNAAGLMDAEIKKSWTHSIKIPIELAGKPVTNKRVNFFNILLKGREWAKEKDYQQLDFWDPDKMHQWAQAAFQRGKYESKTWKGAKGVLIDYSQKELKFNQLWNHNKEPISVLPKPPFTGPWLD